MRAPIQAPHPARLVPVALGVALIGAMGVQPHAAATQAAAPGTGGLTGVVTIDARPVRRAEVTVVVGRSTVRAETDAEGQFSLEGLALGNCTITVRKTGFVQPQPVATIVTSDSRETPVRIAMVPGAVITGQVIDQAGAPLGGFQTVLMGPTLQRSSMALTDDRGIFRFHTLQPGWYQIQAGGLFYPNAASPAEAERLLVGAGETAEVRVVRAPPAARGVTTVVERKTSSGESHVTSVPPVEPRPERGVLTGRVVDEFGDPAPDVAVAAANYREIAGRAALMPITPVRVTDDRGVFRIPAVPVGGQYVMAIPASYVSASRPAEVPSSSPAASFALTIYPGTTIHGDGRQVQVENQRETDVGAFAVIPAGTSGITGRVTWREEAAWDVPILLLPLDDSGRLPFTTPLAVGRTTAAGLFSIDRLSPGTYAVQAMGPGFASRVVTVKSSERTRVDLDLSLPATVRGRLVIEGPLDAPAAPQIRASFVPADAISSPARGVASAMVVRDDGTFQVGGMFGRSVLTIDVPEPWTLIRVTSAGLDMTDRPFDAAAGDANDVELVLAPRASRVTCRVSTPEGAPQSKAVILIFSEDPTRLAYPSRYVRALSPDAKGECSVSGLPPSAYRAIAFRELPRPDWMNPEFLRTQFGGGQRFVLNHGDTVSLRFEVGR